eukprot:SAG22_NODE_167_length_16764_cov_34.845245_9_plen_102_part_00
MRHFAGQGRRQLPGVNCSDAYSFETLVDGVDSACCGGADGGDQSNCDDGYPFQCSPDCAVAVNELRLECADFLASAGSQWAKAQGLVDAAMTVCYGSPGGI